MRVVINLKEDGGFDVITDEPCEVYAVSDFTPSDRVYLLTEAHSVGRELVDAALADDTVGHSGDSKHAVARSRILEADDGVDLAAVTKPTVN